MPFSSDGDAIDFIYGVMNWKKVEAGQESVAVPVAAEPDVLELDTEAPMEDGKPTEDAATDYPRWYGHDETPDVDAAEDETAAFAEPAPPPPPHFSWEDGPLAE